MRIFAAVRHSKVHSSSSLWTRNFYPALAELGHEVVESQTDLDPGSRFMDVSGGFTRQENSVREELTNRIVAELKLAHEQKPIGLFLSYFYNSHFHPDGFDEIRRMGIPSVNFYCNSIYQFELTEQIAAKVDFAWHAEKHARGSYLAVGARPVWVQMGADPVVYRPHEVGRSGQVCFVGRRYADRDRCAAAVIEAGIPFDLFGDGWGRQRTSRLLRMTTGDTTHHIWGGLVQFRVRCLVIFTLHIARSSALVRSTVAPEFSGKCSIDANLEHLIHV